MRGPDANKNRPIEIRFGLLCVCSTFVYIFCAGLVRRWQAQNKLLKQKLIQKLNDKLMLAQKFPLTPEPVLESEPAQESLADLQSEIADLNELADKIEFVKPHLLV